MKQTLQGLQICMQDEQDEESLAHRWESVRRLRVQATHSLTEGAREPDVLAFLQVRWNPSVPQLERVIFVANLKPSEDKHPNHSD